MTATTTARKGANGSIDMTGWCRDCRAYSHKLCVAVDCACTMGRHDKRGAVEPPEDPLADVRARANGGGSAPPASGKPVAKGAAPVWQLVKADPPAPEAKKQKNVEMARPLLEQLMAEDDKAWHRLAVFPSSMGASQTCGRMRKAYPREWEWRAVKVAEISQSALYVRWLGKTRTGQL